LCGSSDLVRLENALKHALHSIHAKLAPPSIPPPTDPFERPFPLLPWSQLGTDSPPLPLETAPPPAAASEAQQEWFIGQLSLLYHPVFAFQWLSDHLSEDLNAPLALHRALSLLVKALELVQVGFDALHPLWGSLDLDKPNPRFSAATTYWNLLFNKLLEKAETLEKVLQTHQVEDTLSIEMLVVDQVLDMSKEAAVSELVGDDVFSSYKNYAMAVWMLHGLLFIVDGQQKLPQDTISVILKLLSSLTLRMNVLETKLHHFENS